MRRLLFLLIILFFVSKNTNAQFQIGIKISGIAYHPQYTNNAEVYKWKIDKKGHFVGFASITITASYNFNQYIGIKAFQSFIGYDCGGKFSGISHIGLNVTDDFIGIKNNFHHLSASMGPFWYYRKGWNKIDAYNRDPDFINQSKRNKDWEYLFVWHGGQIQYDYFYQKNQAFSANILPGYPYIYTAAFGSSVRM